MEKVTLPVKSKPIIRRLDGRLRHLYCWAAALNNYDHIWDVCCDHGRLGMHFWADEQFKNSQINLVDSVPHIIEKLRQQYGQCEPSRLFFYAQDASAIALKPGKHLIIIAGVGGETAAKILAGIMHLAQPHSAIKIDFLISPNSHTFWLRQQAHALGLSLEKEEFITEKNRHHEHLHYRYKKPSKPLIDEISQEKISSALPIGQAIWHPLTAEKKTYLTNLTAHYGRQAQNGGHPYAKEAAAAYSKLFEQ